VGCNRMLKYNIVFATLFSTVFIFPSGKFLVNLFKVNFNDIPFSGSGIVVS
jgi:hypothetical protein